MSLYPYTFFSLDGLLDFFSILQIILNDLLERFNRSCTSQSILGGIHHITPTQSINEITYKCGFNNMSNFNPIFKKKKACTPKEFRDTYTSAGVRTFI